ncbi:phosphatase domain-containing protein [Kocuria sp. M1R5S2]|uniref:phosphatase domain-containing protein n=1 Tax=Kocuria rhizosphaerae TaxID=3376285 RepID=UPI0037B9A1AD
MTIKLCGTTTTVTSDSAGIIDARLPLDSPWETGTTRALLHPDGPEQVPATLHVMNAEPVRGVVCDIDDIVWFTGISHPARAAWRTLRGSSSTRQSAPGMARLLRTAVGRRLFWNLPITGLHADPRKPAGQLPSRGSRPGR